MGLRAPSLKGERKIHHPFFWPTMIEVQCGLISLKLSFRIYMNLLEIMCALVDQLSLTVKVTNPFGVEVEA